MSYRDMPPGREYQNTLFALQRGSSYDDEDVMREGCPGSEDQRRWTNSRRTKAVSIS